MINIKNSLSGRFKIEAFKAVKTKDGLQEIEGSRTLKSDWFTNIILDQGINGLGTRSPSASVWWCHVGTGNSTPVVTDTSLQMPLANTGTKQTSLNSAQTATQPYYIARTVVFRFTAGQATGNLAEVGVGWSSASNSLFSRTLIKDSFGDPSTITVLADEYLDVTYELRIYPDTSDSIGTVDIAGVVYDYVARPSSLNANAWSMDRAGNASNNGTSLLFSGNIGSIFGEPSGSSTGANSGGGLSYTPGSHTAGCSYTYGLTNGNFAGGVRSVTCTIGWTKWQIEFSAQSDSSTIPKDSTKILSLTYYHSWARGA